MRKLFAIILLLSCEGAAGQNDQYTVYTWNEVINASPDTVYAISLSKNKLDSLPEALFRFTNLRYLDLHKNKLKTLPDAFVQLTSLEELNLGKNKFDIFPVQLCSLKSLRRLSLYSNDIESLPACIEYIAALENLDLYDNPIRTLPESMVKLSNLKSLDLSGIKFSPEFQENWSARLPGVEIEFDPPCDCMR